MGRIIAAMAAAAMVLLTGCGGGGDSSSAATVTVTSTVVQPEAGTTETVTYTPPPPPGPASVISTDGTYLVGEDIQAGRYRTAGPVSSGSGGECYWKRLSSLDSSDIIDNEGSAGPQVIEIMPSDVAFSTSNCQPWQSIS